MQHRIALVAALAVGSLGSPSHAQEDPQRTAVAKTLNEAAVKEMDQKDFASACPRLEEAVRFEPAALGAHFTLAECYEGAGRLASAWATFLQVEQAAVRANQQARSIRARARAAALHGRLSRFTLKVPDAVKALPGLEISRDGLPVGPTQWGLPIPIDRGHHNVVITAPGKERLEESFEVFADGQDTELSVSMPQDLPAASPAAPTLKQPAPPPSPAVAQGPFRGMPWIHVAMSDGDAEAVALYRVGRTTITTAGALEPINSTSVTEMVCWLPCDQVVDGRSGTFFLGLDEGPSSERFRHDDKSGRVAIIVRPGSSLGISGGYAMAIIGLGLSFFGVVGLPLEASEGRAGMATLAGLSLAAGAVMVPVGIRAVMHSKMTYSFASF